MRFCAYRFNDLTNRDLICLSGLTNNKERGDNRDDGTAAGSLFRNQIDDRMMGESFPNSHVIIARHYFRYVGWCMITSRDIDPDSGKKLTIPEAQVGFYVHPDFRRQGLGKRLLQEAQDLARKNGIGRLLVNPWNKSSASFFESVGFDEVEDYVTGVNFGLSMIDVDLASTKTG